jgi:hypothetical protein
MKLLFTANVGGLRICAASAKTMTPEKPPTIQIGLSTILPFIMGLCSTSITMVIGEKYGWDTMPIVLVGYPET